MTLFSAVNALPSEVHSGPNYNAVLGDFSHTVFL